MVHGTGVLLLAAVGGYWVLERAATHKGNLKNVGQLLGWLIILVSLAGVACRVWCLSTGKLGYGPMGMGKGQYCPFIPKTPASPPVSE